MLRPSIEEYPVFFDKYVQKVSDGEIEEVLNEQLSDALALLSGVDDARGNYRYGPDKWTLKEVIGHINDCERIMSYRLLRIARGDKTPMQSFDENQYVNAAIFNQLSLTQLIEEFTLIRKATIALIRGITDEAYSRTGTVSDHPMSARALAYVVAGHEKHHMLIIKERYLA
ncbi:MAG: DinB family protein [Candidatus Cohnella colombiensis]|uniref:DinB family protein n=1 Tax=Candidatus Cohnella colombiensis TaxID=3121368 RepID=A0AA95JEB5_9BACL|nr:MAG: DinB family protein [Cohnella sp.]